MLSGEFQHTFCFEKYPNIQPPQQALLMERLAGRQGYGVLVFGKATCSSEKERELRSLSSAGQAWPLVSAVLSIKSVCGGEG